MSTELETLHSALGTVLTAGLPGVALYEDYPLLDDGLDLPAVVLELEEVDFGEDRITRTGQWVARCLVAADDTGAEMSVRKLALSVAALLTAAKPLPAKCSAPTVQRVAPENADLDGLLIWTAEFTTTIHLTGVLWSAP